MLTDCVNRCTRSSECLCVCVCKRIAIVKNSRYNLQWANVSHENDGYWLEMKSKTKHHWIQPNGTFHIHFSVSLNEQETKSKNNKKKNKKSKKKEKQLLVPLLWIVKSLCYWLCERQHSAHKAENLWWLWFYIVQIRRWRWWRKRRRINKF